MRRLEMESKRIRSKDGADIVYHVTPGDGPWIVLINGLGARHTAWRHQIDYLRDQYRFITWEYRGLHDPSGWSPPPSRPIQTHARDMLTVLEAENVTGGVWMGWSIGVQVMLETMRDPSARPDLLVMLNGTFGRLPGRRTIVRRVFPTVLDLLDHAHPLVVPVVRRVARWPETVSWLKRLGAAGPTIDQEALGEVVANFADMDVGPYLQTLRALLNHEIDDVLDAIEAPTLVIIGEHDPVTTKGLSASLARRIPQAEMFMIRGGTHYVALEFPELVNLRLEKFLREHGVSLKGLTT